MSSIPRPGHQYTLALRRRLVRSARRVGVLGPSQVRNDDVSLASLPKSLRKDAHILDVTMDGGANLASLLAAGYSNAVGWAGRGARAKAMRRRHPELRDATIHVGGLALVLRGFGDDQFALAIAQESLSPLGDHDTANGLVRVASTVVLVGPRQHGPDDVVATALRGAGMTEHADRPLPASPSRGPLRVREFRRMEQVSTLYDFWRQPEPEGNRPAGYVRPTGRSQALAATIADVPSSARILEIGCNVGRNLAYLHDHGYHGVEGIEINPHAIALLRETFPQLASTVIHEGPAGEHLPKFADDEFDVIFTMAVIEHLHPDEADTVFDHMVRVGKAIVAIEPEPRLSHRQFPHDVPAVFRARGLELVSAKPMSEFPSNASDPTMQAFTAWRFRRPAAHSTAGSAPRHAGDGDAAPAP